MPAPARINPKTVAPLIALICALLLCAAAPAAHAACPAGKTAFKTKGKTVCLKTAPVKLDPASAKPESVLARLVTANTRPAKFSKFKIGRKLGRKIPAAIRAATKLMRKIQTQLPHSRAARYARMLQAAGTPVIDRKTFDAGTIDLGQGVKLKLSGEAIAHADDSMDLTMAMTLDTHGAKLKITPMIDWNSAPPKVGCPTAEGEVVIKGTEVNGVTVTGFKNGRITGSVTARETETVTSRGHVGRDARLHDVSSEVAIKKEHYERGLQVVSEYSGTVTSPREGAPAASAPGNVIVKIRAATASSAQERAAERDEAEAISADPGTGKSLGNAVSSHRFHLLENERKWYDIPNSCATAVYTPDSVASLAQGASAAVQGTVKAADGGVAHAQFTVESVARGEFTTKKATSDPGAPAEFSATGGAPDEDKFTVETSVIATSTAGRTDANWHARDEGSIDVTFSGHGEYQRDDGAANANTENHVTASYDWSVTYRGVNLSTGADTVGYATTNSVTGTWSDVGRHGVAGPGDFVCGGPVIGFSGQFAMIYASKSSGGFKLTAMPYFVAQYDSANKTCTGLGAPPYETFSSNGYSLPHQAVLEFDPDDLGSGPLTIPVAPTAQIAADCSDLVTSHLTPCSQSMSWSGSVTVKLGT